MDDGLSDVLLTMRGIVKTYPGVAALKGVDFDVRAGEIHGLVGENGAGKTTLLKVIGGLEVPDEGSIHVGSQPVSFASPRDSQRLGIRFIHQEFDLFPGLSVAENICLDSLPSRHGFVDQKAVRGRAAAALARLGVDLPLNECAGGLSVADQQLIEIARALTSDARVLIMDEPTAALTDHEIQALFEVIRGLRLHGVGVVFVSHRMEEVLELSDRVTVMRDGAVVGETTELRREDIVRLIVGRQLSEGYPKAETQRGREILAITGLSVDGRLEDITFSLHQSEVLGLAGVVGSGRTTIGMALFGLLPASRGSVRIHGETVRIKSPKDALRHGIGYVPEDRQALGLILQRTVRHNETLAVLPHLSRYGWLDEGRERTVVAARVDELRIRTPSLDALALHLSGGNQQKLVLAKWLETHPAVLILDEPTRGVDVGAKAEIYEIIASLVRNGVGILLISSDLPELLGLSDRVVVLREGRQVEILDREAATQERVLHLTTMGVTA